MSNDLIFYTQIGSIALFIVALFVLYRLLVDQKEATIQLLKEKNEWLQKQLDVAKESSPDVVMKTLNHRIKILTDEIERLSKDKVVNEDLIKEKSEQLEKTAEAQRVMRDYTQSLHHYIDILKWSAKHGLLDDSE